MTVLLETPSTATAGVSRNEVRIRKHGTVVESGSKGAVPEELIVRARKAERSLGSDAAQRTVLLGILLARLEGVPFEAVSELLDLRPARLVKIMHGEEQIPTNREKRWGNLAEVLNNLHAVLKQEATWKWLNTEIPALGGVTPFSIILRRDGMDRVKSLTASYHNPSFA